MGYYKFRLSSIIPSSWYYKLKNKSNTSRNQQTKASAKPTNKNHTSPSSSSSLIANQPHLSEQRKSYYFPRELTNPPLSDKHFPVEPPRKSSNRRRRRRRRWRSTRRYVRSPGHVSSSNSATGCSCRAALGSVWIKNPHECPAAVHSDHHCQTSSSGNDSTLPEYGSSDDDQTPDTFDGMLSWSTSCQCKAKDENSAVIYSDDNNTKLLSFSGEFDSRVSELAPIITKEQLEPRRIGERNNYSVQVFAEKTAYESGLSVQVVKDEDYFSSSSKADPAARRLSVGRAGMESKKRRGVWESSLVVVKSSKDPRRDFMESMVEMIEENDLRESKDLEELLAWYLSLNSDEYHHLIINVFKQVWCDLVIHPNINELHIN